MSQSKPRPRLFRALGTGEPPNIVHIEGRCYHWEKTIKHDSWAATALYRAAPSQTIYQSSSDNLTVADPEHSSPACPKIVCKFNRIEPILGLPTRWFGHWLAKRESDMYQQLADLPNVSRGYHHVIVEGSWQKHVAAHDYIEGHPLRWHDQVSDSFFEELHQTLMRIHEKGIAYVDLNKWENIIIDRDGKPHLIDFQISLKLPGFWPMSWILSMFQQSDLYHLSKHAHRIRPDLYAPDHFGRRPWYIDLHRFIAVPFRTFRRRLLVALGIRKGQGKPQSETFIEEGLRPIAKGRSLIEQLYQSFESEAYRQDATERGLSLCQAVFEDAMGRPPCHATELPSVQQLETCTPHDQIVWILKSPAVMQQTDDWRAEPLQQILRRVEARLSIANKLLQEAA